MKHRHFICRLIAAVIMVTSACSSLSASAIEGISFGIGSPHRMRSSQTYTNTVSSANYVPYDTDTNIAPAIVTASAETDEDAPVISLSSPYTHVPDYISYFYLDFDVENASSYEFYSSDSSYATVNSDGYVRVYYSSYANSVTITLRAYYLSDTSKYVEKSVTIYTPYTTTTMPTPTIDLYQPDKSDLYVGNTFKLDYNIYYEWAAYYKSFSSSDESVATVDDNGYVTITGVGTVTITAETRTTGGSSSRDSVTFTTYDPQLTTTTRTTTTTTRTTTTTTVPAEPEVHLYNPSVSNLNVGNSFYLDYEIYNAYYVSSQSFSSSNESVATVNDYGYVTITGVGTVTITLSVGDSFGRTVTDSVTFTTYYSTTEMAPISINLYEPSESVLYVGNTFKLGYDVTNYSFGSYSVSFSSSNESIATVDDDGYVTITGAGTVTITLSVRNSLGITFTDSVTFTTYDKTATTTTTTTTTTTDTTTTIYDNYIGELQLNQVYSGSIRSNSADWFKFTAPYSGSYVFESTGSYDTYGLLYSSMSSSSSLAYNDDGGTNNNFKITYSLTQGQTVYLKVRGYNGDAVSTYDVSVVSDSGQTAAPAIIPALLTMNPGDTNNLFVINVPDGASVLWTSDNTSVATVSDGIVKAIAPGTAKIFAIVGDTLCSCTVNVVSKDYNPGDVDGNGTVEIADAVKIMCYLTDPENNPINSKGIMNGDVYQTGDGLSVQDALTIQKYLSQIITSLSES